MLTNSLFKKPLNALEGSGRHNKVNRPFIPDDLYIKCPSCKTMLLSTDLKENHYVCQKCQHNFRLDVYKRQVQAFKVENKEDLDAVAAALGV